MRSSVAARASCPRTATAASASSTAAGCAPGAGVRSGARATPCAMRRRGRTPPWRTRSTAASTMESASPSDWYSASAAFVRTDRSSSRSAATLASIAGARAARGSGRPDGFLFLLVPDTRPGLSRAEPSEQARTGARHQQPRRAGLPEGGCPKADARRRVPEGEWFLWVFLWFCGFVSFCGFLFGFVGFCLVLALALALAWPDREPRTMKLDGERQKRSQRPRHWLPPGNISAGLLERGLGVGERRQ
mmetsp:Transcript_11127/g.37876  ORF Transcript_11127/g.37876 Transcript_11127/m.37876 type:complete len:247 (+) Transcript_11127:353-1093(+)